MTEHSFTSTLTIFILLVFLKGCFSLDFSYEGCAPKHCGDGKSVSFPFYIDGLQDPNCGYPGFQLSCNKNGSSVFQISGNNDYLVEHIDYDNHTMRLLNSQIISCPSAITNLTFNQNLFTIYSFWELELVFLSNCSKELPKNLTGYKINGTFCDPVHIDDQLVMIRSDPNVKIGKEVCSNLVMAPAELEDGEVEVNGTNYREVMKGGFTRNWHAPNCSRCQQSGGRCGYISNISQLTCLCPDDHSSKDNSCVYASFHPSGTTRTSKTHMAVITGNYSNIYQNLSFVPFK
uniref:LEAF RUST 10 DISEASE-RESISTANCE LOCUS RECEPTOR-LIKE PROTEIN KINASE-like 1.2 n=1 Tax=Erigeron canadensis TaxID=72917 RepID=UPI001CB94A4F|nr:LEAF RUST 10 DISEASE-RESISTANCE LOCUS RECEPTOR-LIKE PROTEIN KINASE-like 1.2 [Erigeron canadensis]